MECKHCNRTFEDSDRVALIRKCAEPWDKKCRCDAHRDYFNNTLD